MQSHDVTYLIPYAKIGMWKVMAQAFTGRNQRRFDEIQRSNLILKLLLK